MADEIVTTTSTSEPVFVPAPDANLDVTNRVVPIAPNQVKVATPAGVVLASNLDQLGVDWAAFMDAQPDGSRAEYVDHRWHFYRGRNGPVGSGQTLARAILTCGATRAPDPSTGKMVELSEFGEVIPPEVVETTKVTVHTTTTEPSPAFRNPFATPVSEPSVGTVVTREG